MPKFLILSIDGGGLRGVVPLTVLQHIQSRVSKPVLSYFSLVAGTSTGGLIASALTLPGNQRGGFRYTLEEVLEVYKQDGNTIFPMPMGAVESGLRKVWSLFSATYPEEGIKKVFDRILGEARLADAKVPLLISSYDLFTNRPLFFKSRQAREFPAFNALLYDVCRATSAGPTYLPAHEMSYPLSETDDYNPRRMCIDGGIFINNPSMAALAEFSKHHVKYGYPSNTQGDINYEDVFVLSLGTGSFVGQAARKEDKQKGLLYWAPRMPEVMMRGVNQSVDYQMKQMMENGNYLRLTMDIAEEEYSAMDRADPAITQYLIEQTVQQVIQHTGKMEDLNRFLEKAGMTNRPNAPV